jgi:phospholipid-binding lipoprotein MlaA
VVPGVARQGVTNVFANLGDAWSFVNNLLQLQLEGAFNSAVRFSVNTVLGIGGLFDIASEAGVERHKQDFGLTMARWGVPSGPYLVLPLLGPSSVRDTAGFVVDWEGDIVSRRVNDIPVHNSLYVLRAVNKRANLLGVTSVLDYAALDKYAFTRDAYLQMRAQQAGQELLLDDADDDAGRLPPEE